MRKACPLLLVAGVVASLALPAIAGLAVPEVAGAAPATTLSSLVTTHIPAGFVSTARGSGASDLPTTTDPGAQTGQVPVSPELYLRDPAKARGVDPLPTLWRLWWDPTSQRALTVSLARYPDASLATKAVATLDAALTGSTGSRGLALTSVFVPAGLPGAHGYNLSAAASATPTKSPFTVSAVLFRSGTVEYLVSMLAGGTEPATGAVSSLAVAQYHDAMATPLARPPVAAPSGSSWPWIAGAAALVVLVLLALVARRRAVVRRRRRRMHRQRRAPGSHPPAHRRSSLSR